MAESYRCRSTLYTIHATIQELSFRSKKKIWCASSRALFDIVRHLALAYCHLIDSNGYLIPFFVVFENVCRRLFVAGRAVSSDTLAQPRAQLINLILRYHQVSYYIL